MRGLADSHAHLHAYDDAALEAMFGRARAAGVERVLAVSVDVPSARRTLEIRARFPGVLAAVGFHPAHVAETPGWSDLECIACESPVDAIGECGVDEADGTASEDVQIELLASHARLARDLDKPLLLHLRGHDLVVRALSTLAQSGMPGGRSVVHYFVGDGALARRYLDAGLLISVGKPVTRLENVALRKAIAATPLDLLLLETDAYPLPGRTTEPADVHLIAGAVADLHGTTLERVARVTGESLSRLLGA